MRGFNAVLVLGVLLGASATTIAQSNVFSSDPRQRFERTCFQTGQAWSANGNLRSDVAIVYGIDAGLPERIQTWRDHGYRIHVMTGVSWGRYQDYLYGRFDGINHEDEAQTMVDGRKRSHGGDVYYMCPGTNFGKFLCVGVQRALEAGAEAIHLEEPEFWVDSGYSDGFKREWKAYYNEDWIPPHSSVDAQWRSSKLKYFLYRRALQQVFDYVQEFNQKSGRDVRCYVPTHSLLNYAHWRIVSPESSLGRLNGCSGYIAQVWTGTSRTPNLYQGVLQERTFETAFLEYAVMQNLVRATGRSVWYLNDPIEDNPNHDWTDYRRNWESTLVASLLQPDVWKFEVAPWPERIFGGRYPRRARGEERRSIPPDYATELQTVMNQLNELKQEKVSWDCGTQGIGLLVSDSLMFQRGPPAPSDPHLSHVYGLALPLLKRGCPLAPVQLEYLTVPKYLEGLRVLLLSYQGMKPLSAEVHVKLAEWVKAGGVLIAFDDDSDPFNAVREWWNTGDLHYATPRQHLFEQLGINAIANETQKQDEMQTNRCGQGFVFWVKQDPAQLATNAEGANLVVKSVRSAAEFAKVQWRESNYLLLKRGPYVVAAGLDESVSETPKVVQGRFVNLLDPQLEVKNEVRLTPGSRFFLRDLSNLRGEGAVIASACKTLLDKQTPESISFFVEGVARTPAVVLLHVGKAPRAVKLDDQPLDSFRFSEMDQLLWIRFENESAPRKLFVEF